MLRRTIAITSASLGILAVSLYIQKNTADASSLQTTAKNTANPTRTQLLTNLKHSQFDLLIIGGGATGAGCALDAAKRGLNVACVERDDFSAGTSSRSTKLVHGGVRYLEKAFLELDWGQYSLVVEALQERSTFLKIAPHLSHELAIMLPIYSWIKIPYYWAGAKFYDLLAGSHSLSHSYFVNRRQSLEMFPMLKRDAVKGAIVYYDGMHNDSRMNVAIALTANAHGATCVNHVEVQSLKKKDGVLCGAVVRDMLTGEQWTVEAKGVINATGPFTDSIRKMDSGIMTKNIVSPSSGVHIILPSYFSAPNMGLLDPNTSDGRVIFFLPWHGSVIAGTTDSPCSIGESPIPSDEDVDWILKEVQVRRSDVQAAWSGIRPLVTDPNSTSTEGLVRSHLINVSDSGLITIAGGKWTTYRAMSEETIDLAIKRTTILRGGDTWTPDTHIKLIQKYGFDLETSQHLSLNYGDFSWEVADLACTDPQNLVKIAQGYPFIEAEILYACRNELACTLTDVIARRTRLSFLNASACRKALPRIVEVMGDELGWPVERRQSEIANAEEFLKSMGLSVC